MSGIGRDRNRPSWLRRLANASGGNVALIFALSMPMIAVLAAGSVEIAQVVSDRHRTQDVADSAAIDGAQQLSVTPSGAAARAGAFAATQLHAMAKYASVTITSSQLDPSTMRVAIDTHRMSFFGNLLPPGGFFTHAEATAKAEGMTPLCLLNTGVAAPGLHLTGSSQIQAAQCLVHTDQNLAVDGGAGLSAGVVEATGTVTGGSNPAANAGAKAIDDPFASVNLAPPTQCNIELIDFSKGVTGILAAGLHCSDVVVAKHSTMTMAAGTHWFKTKLEMDTQSSIDGTAGVTLIFLNGSTLLGNGKPNKQNVQLRGSKTGPLAGFVLATARDYAGNFQFPSDNIDEITGTIYIPNSTLEVHGSSKSAGTSPWTVVVAQGMTMNDSSNVVFNSNYAGADVPVPIGVGRKSGSAVLTH